MANVPKISVIVPIYGVEKYLREAVDSILNQTLCELEILLIDDGGKDNCPQIIDEYAQKDSRIIAIHKPNGGYGQTCNIGLERATGEYIAILEPDDYIDSKMYDDLYKIAKEHNSDIVKSCFYENLQSRQANTINKINWRDEIPENTSFTIKEYPYFLYYHPSIWSCIYKKEFLTKHAIKFVEAPGAGWTDNPFQVQTMCLAERINYTSKAYYYWRVLNYFESESLKDYTIPFKRTKEIHEWLEENKIDDENILIQLYRRELAYVNIVLGMKKISDKSDCYTKIKELIANCPNNFGTNKTVSKNEKQFFNAIKKNPRIVRLKKRISMLRKNLITIRWNKREIRVVLLSKKIFRKEFI